MKESRPNGNNRIDRSQGCREGETISELYQRRIDAAAAAGEGLRLLAIPRAADIVGLSEGLCRELVRSGQLPSVAVGRRRRVTVEALRRFAQG